MENPIEIVSNYSKLQFAEIIKNLRGKRTYRKAAQDWGVDAGLICRIELGQRPLTQKAARKIAQFENARSQ